MLSFTVEQLRRRAVGQAATWLVHPENAAMARLSAKVGALREGVARIRPLHAESDIDYVRWRLDL